MELMLLCPRWMGRRTAAVHGCSFSMSTVHRARTLREVGYFGPIFPDGQGDRSNCCVPTYGTAQILTWSKNSDIELKQTMFPNKNATWLSESAVFALCLQVPRRWVVFRVVTGTLIYYGALCAHCRSTP